MFRHSIKWSDKAKINFKNKEENRNVKIKIYKFVFYAKKIKCLMLKKQIFFSFCFGMTYTNKKVWVLSKSILSVSVNVEFWTQSQGVLFSLKNNTLFEQPKEPGFTKEHLVEIDVSPIRRGVLLSRWNLTETRSGWSLNLKQVWVTPFLF